MKPEDQERFGPLDVALRDGTRAVIRPLSVDDGDALGDFYESVPREDVRFYCPHPLDREHAERNAARALSPLEVVLVLDVSGAIGGYAWYRWKEPDAPKSGFGICVARPCQGRGAGRALTDRLMEIAPEIGPPVMALTVQLANAKAVEFYKKLGFRVVREQVRNADPRWGFAAELEYAMEKVLRPPTG